MAGLKKYYNKDVDVIYHPEEKIISLRGKKSSSKDDVANLEDKIKNVLSVTSTDENKGEKTLSLDDASNELSVSEFLQTFLDGGKEEQDAEDIGQNAARQDAQVVQPPPPTQGMPQQGVAPMTPPGASPMSPAQEPAMEELPPPPEEEVPTTESVNAFEIMFESNYLKESTYRSAEYWDVLKSALGKGVQYIDSNDILSARRLFTKKKKSSGRDRVLRALDQSYRYFIRFLNKTNPEQVDVFKRKYRTIGYLTPLDYAENSDTTSNIETEPEEMEKIDFSDFFSDDTKEGEESDKSSENRYAPEEEYPE